MPFWGPIIGAAIGVLGGLSIQRRQEKVAREAEQRNQAYLEDSKANDLSKTVKAAEKAGINPLTAIRSGAGNYQSNRAIMPSMSGYQFALEALSSGANQAISYAETYKERALEALYKTTQIDAMNVDIKLAKSKLAGMGQTKDVYAGYNDFIPVKFGLKSFKMPISMARRMGIEPNDILAAGEIAELFGEGSEFITNFAAAGQLETFGITTVDLASGDEEPKTVVSKQRRRTNKIEDPDSKVGLFSQIRTIVGSPQPITTTELPRLSSFKLSENYRDRFSPAWTIHNY